MAEATLIRAIAVDDEAPALRVIARLCAEVPFFRLEKTFQKPTEALAWLEQHPVDLLFLDIQMPSQSGVDLYKALSPAPLVIFTTAHSGYAVEGFTLNALDYLLKPITFERFRQAAEKAREYMALRATSPGPEMLVVRADYGQVPVALADIVFIEGSDDYARIYLEGRKPLIVRTTLKMLLDRLPAAAFLRVHRSFIVPLARIENVRNKVVHVGGREIPIGASYEREFFERFKK
ncbi:LytR/AlgR family response regulator transcription factor [Dinghuibacter silviterrae]|uniref:LytTR family two component transcriptional regulator n=1 Tax=Dinghuibacter silviterrae TaxID=1539049 RepID=A0A4R8DTF2_9BACT|nr:LytTR family DNA-binding domain-containing protein [Dinghuibacter silviterrae]TDX01582.1 LytTR family two component transcriptional regulator [Dinghuibacter silviterrae]